VFPVTQHIFSISSSCTTGLILTLDIIVSFEDIYFLIIFKFRLAFYFKYIQLFRLNLNLFVKFRYLQYLIDVYLS